MNYWPDQLLAGGIGILPLAPLTDDAAVQMPDVLRTIDRRLSDEADRDEADKLRAATSILMSLRHSADVIHQLLKGMWPMWENVLEDSSIIKEYVQRAEQRGVKIGEERGVRIGEERAIGRFREALLRLGERQFGPPDPASRVEIANVTDPNRQAMLSERILEVKSWRELLA